MILLRTFVLIFGCISFIIVIGGATYEHVAVIPSWSAAVPSSLAMFQGEYALKAAPFWMTIHPVTLGLLVSALVFNWRTDRMLHIAATIAGYGIILALTFAFFVPELIAITQSEYSMRVDPELTRRANLWEMLSLVRLAFLIVLAIILLFGLSRSAEARAVKANGG